MGWSIVDGVRPGHQVLRSPLHRPARRMLQFWMESNREAMQPQPRVRSNPRKVSRLPLLCERCLQTQSSIPIIDESTGYMCHDWTLKEQSQVDSSSEKDVCEGLGLISTDGLFLIIIIFSTEGFFTFHRILVYKKAKTPYLQLGGVAFLSLWLQRKLMFDERKVSFLRRFHNCSWLWM